MKNKKTASLLMSISKKRASDIVSEAPIIDIKDTFNIKHIDDSQLNNYLNEKGNELLLNEINSSLEAGKILSNVFEKLSGKNQYDGLYNHWLKNIGYNPRTALRHRIRYTLFNLVTTEESKKLIAILPIKLIEKLYSSELKDKILKLIDNRELKNKEDLLLILENKENLKIENIKPITPFYKPLFAYENKIGKMNKEDSKKALDEILEAKKEIQKIENLLKKNL